MILLKLLVHKSKRRKGTSLRKHNCSFRIVAIDDPVRLKWKAFIKEEHHNRDPSSEPTSHPSHRRAGVGTVEANGRYTPPKKYACQYGWGSTRGYGHQSNFEGLAQYGAEG
jgi:hypothetical protein